MKTRRLFGTAFAILWKDVKIEARTGEVTVTTGLFALLVTVISSLAFHIRAMPEPTIENGMVRQLAMEGLEAREVAPGVLWLTVAFAGVVAMTRTWARERDRDVLRAMLMAPIPRASIYIGKGLGTLAFLLVIEAILVPVVGVLFNIDMTPYVGRLALLLFLGTFGYVAAGTLFSVMTVRTSARDLALSVVLFPLVAPALLGAVTATRNVFGGLPLDDTLAWARILVAFDLLFLFAGIALFELLTRD